MFRPVNMIPTMPPQCSCYPCTVNQTVISRRQAYLLNNYPTIVVPRPAIPIQPRTVSEDPHVTGVDRAHFLRKSVYRLIYESIYLALTDPKLLGWYLGLSPEDRKIIQDEGGFHQFLRRHPALELSKHHVYVKNIIPEEARENLPQCDRAHSYNQHQDSLHTSYISPASQRVDPKVQELSKLTWQMESSSGGYNVLKNPQHMANLSLDMELEKHIQGVNAQSTSVNHRSATGKHFDGVLPNGAELHCNRSDMLFRESDKESSLNEDAFYSILEADKSIVLCVPKENPHTNTSGFYSGEVGSKSEALTSSHTDNCVIRTTAERSTSPSPPVCTCDVMVGTKQTFTTSVHTQTEQPQTAEKHFNTEVYMLDLDYLTKEFIAIKTERDELLEKVKMLRTKSPLAKIVNDLRKLETDYNKMREKILSGISLQDLKPLSLDLEETTTNSTVAKIISDMKTASLGSSEHQDETLSDELVPHSENCINTLESQTMRDATKKDTSTTKRAVTRVLKDRGTNQRPEGKPLDTNTSEAWYDAQEVLPSEGSGVQPKVDEKCSGDDLASDKQKTMSAGLCVSGLPSYVTESDVMQWFEKYLVSEVHISNLKELRVAIVIVGTQQSAETAVRELNGLRIKGHTLQVERINPGRPEDQGQASTCTSDPESLNSPSKNQNQKLTTSPSFSPTKKKVVCVSPTAQGTFVPQHYGTMGSFDILMSELTQRHPNVGRQIIVDALLELRAKYRGVLSGLPLRTIREMTSDLLTRPASST